MPWTHTVFSFNGSTVTGFFNGVESFSGTIAPASNSAYPMGVGNNAVGSTDTWDDPIDELRIDKYASSVDWAKASYENQKPNSTFLKIDNFKGTPVFDSTIKAVYAKKGVAISAFTPIVATGGTKAFSAVGLPPGISINASTPVSG